MAKQAGFWSVDDRLAEISAGGDPLETLNATVDFERFRPILERAAGKARSAKGGRPSLDVVLKFRMLVLQSLHGLSLEATERMVRDRLSWMRFCGLGIADGVPDANTLWDFREALIKADALDALFQQLDHAINQAGFIPHAGQIMDASLIAAPRQRTSDGEKAGARRRGRSGRTSPRRRHKKTRTRAGPSSIPRRRRARMAVSPSISRSRPSATRAISRLIARTASSGVRSLPTRLSMTVPACEKAWSRRPTPGAGSGPIPPIARPRTKPGSQPMAW